MSIVPEYTLILFLLLAVSVFLQYRYKIKIFKSAPHRLVFFAVIFLVGVIWDHFAVSRGHWNFGVSYILGPRVGLLPIEEYGFIAIVPYFILVTYKLIEKKLGNKF